MPNMINILLDLIRKEKADKKIIVSATDGSFTQGIVDTELTNSETLVINPLPYPEAQTNLATNPALIQLRHIVRIQTIPATVRTAGVHHHR